MDNYVNEHVDVTVQALHPYTHLHKNNLFFRLHSSRQATDYVNRMMFCCHCRYILLTVFFLLQAQNSSHDMQNLFLLPVFHAILTHWNYPASQSLGNSSAGGWVTVPKMDDRMKGESCDWGICLCSRITTVLAFYDHINFNWRKKRAVLLM